MGVAPTAPRREVASEVVSKEGVSEEAETGTMEAEGMDQGVRAGEMVKALAMVWVARVVSATSMMCVEARGAAGVTDGVAMVMRTTVYGWVL